MRSHQAGQFPGDTIVFNFTANVNLALDVKRGVRYRLVSSQDVWLSMNAAAVVKQGIYLPAKTPDYFAFGMDDSQGTDPTLNVIGAFNGELYLTPLKTIPTEG